MSEVVTKEPKAEVAREEVAMTDGRKVSFAGKKKMLKEVIIEGSNVGVRFDFRNGETRVFTVPQSLLLQCAGHGASQKIGDEVSGVDDLDDIVVGIDTIIERLNAGEWGAARTTGEGGGFSGASVVIKAIMEATGKDAAKVKLFLQGKLDAAKARGEALTRQGLYKSFRNPTTATGKIIARLELEKASKVAGINSDDLLSELNAE